MAYSRIYTELDYEEECKNLKDIIAEERFPIAVRTRSIEDYVHKEKQIGIPGDTELLLLREFKARYARIKVLNFHDNTRTENERGTSFVQKHDSYIGKEFLLPLKYSGQFRFVKRPGGSGRYTSILEVLSDPPTLLKVCNCTEALDVKDMDRRITLPSGTLLHPKRKFRLGSESNSFLECSDGSTSYAFRENASVDFIEEEEILLHQLFELSKDRLLPKVIQFQHTNPQDIVLKDNELKSALFTILEGPIEVESFIDGEFILCRAKRPESDDDEALIIPFCLWESVHVQRRCFLDDNAKEMYLRKNFWHTSCFDSVDKALIIMSINQCTVTWLRCPESLHQKNLIGEENNPDEQHKKTGEKTKEVLKQAKNRKSFVKFLKEKSQQMFRKKKNTFHELTKNEESKEAIGSNTAQYEVLQGYGCTRNKSENSSSDQMYSEIQFSNEVSDSTHANSTFFSYTVGEVTEYFEKCGLKKFALDCCSKRLDGAFFRDFDLNELKFEPFSLKDSEVQKVKEIIKQKCRN